MSDRSTQNHVRESGATTAILRFADGRRSEAVAPGDSRPAGAVWLDLLSPDENMLALAEAWTGIALPGPGSMHQTAPSQRFRRRGQGVTLVLPVASVNRAGDVRVEPMGVMLSRDLMVTVRRHDVAAFQRLNEDLDEVSDGLLTPDHVLVALIEALVGSVADGLAEVATELAPLSRHAFATPVQLGRNGRLAERQLQVVMRTLGRLADGVGQFLEALGWLDAVPEFLHDVSGYPFAPEHAARIAIFDRDIDGLARQAGNTATRVQMLLDATLGAISIRQAAVMKVQSVVATVFLPPTLIASIYGMNFDIIPELHLAIGYPLALGLMVATAILPYMFMKWRGWL